MASFGKKAVTRAAAFGVIFASLLIIFGISVVFTIPVWLLWNWLMPAIFGLTKITLIQAWGVSFLSGLLFKPSSVSDK
jgi:hypothetical protein